MKLCRSGALCAPYNENKEGISLITLIITIIVIIILAAIVIFTGLRTPDSAQFSSFAQQVDNVQVAVTNKFADLKTKHAIAKEYRTDEQIYIEIARASDPGQYAAMNTTTVKNENSTTVSSIEEGSGIQNIDATKSTNEEHSIGMELPKVRENNTAWYVTKEGRVFNANGYTYNDKTYFDAKTYQSGELGSNSEVNAGRALAVYDAMNKNITVVTRAPEDGGEAKPIAQTYAITYKDVGNTTFTGVHESDYPTSYTVGIVTRLKGATKDNFTFEGWYTTSDGNGAAVTTLGENDVNTNIILYAKWSSKGSITTTVGGETVEITKSNFGDYLGKVVTNYKDYGSEYIRLGSTGYNVSKRYRLLWIDYENKYGDGVGTVYLKADCIGKNDIYTLQNDGSSKTSKIVSMNPELYKDGVTGPSSDNLNMLRITWLLDTAKWEPLKESGINTAIGSKVKYVVGAPSLEMMIDSYNMHYKLKGNYPNTGDVSAGGTRKKLYYKFLSGAYGYQVGPGSSSQYDSFTARYTVQTDINVNGIYYPGSSCYYWLASPAAKDEVSVLRVSSDRGGYIGYSSNSRASFCPVVALDSDVKLTLSGS